jgi:hypothetical protein
VSSSRLLGITLVASAAARDGIDKHRQDDPALRATARTPSVDQRLPRYQHDCHLAAEVRIA